MRASPISLLPEVSCIWWRYIDWWCRYILAWKTSATLDRAFCLEAMEMALEFGKPEILNTDQGA